MTALRFDAAAQQWIGGRDRQNDAVLYSDTYAMVADGAGEEAGASAVAQLAVQVWARAAEASDDTDLVTALLRAPAQAERQLADRRLEYSCTLAGAFLDRAGLLWLTSIGDSRVILIREGEVLAATRPHNVGGERLLTDPRAAVSDYQTSLLSRYIRAGHVSTPDILVFEAAPDDVVVAVTDGIDAQVRLAAVLQVVREHRAPEIAASALVDLVRGVEEADNSSCVVARVVAEVPAA